ncbi:Meiotic recombination protein SPO11 [Holothuria leucospilota]|uniref:DNA topoisomerase (ATP-hydrolyzing) n=1 Tax=Holothuria leucospilota TaxID=206669 RepID=A0A9Q1BW13_HOLLE|nr:Meiotic recombination protein SPO11 [Holothuria leucospilota]
MSCGQISLSFLLDSFTQGVGLEIREDASITETRFDSFISRNKFALTMKTLAACYKLVETNTFCTKRDLYYSDPQTYSNQGTLDSIIDNISCMLKVPRNSLHVIATSKGCIAGNLTYKEKDGRIIDCSLTKSGTLISSHVEDIKSILEIFIMYDITSEAKFILVVEKDATFQKLLDEELPQKLYPCIIVTGKGYPDVHTRLMVRLLWDSLHIPVLGLVDADPHGLEILCVYKFGSKAMSHDSCHLTVPCIKWLGILPSDLKRLRVPDEALLPLEHADLKKSKEIMSRPYWGNIPHWMKEMQVLLETGKKAEIQCLTAVSENFLTDVYLPSKIRCGGWI